MSEGYSKFSRKKLHITPPTKYIATGVNPVPPADVRPLPPPYAHGEMGSPAAEFGVDGPGNPRKSGSGRVLAQLTFINGIIMNYHDIYYIYICITYIYIYIYICMAGGSPELRGTISLDAIPERSFLYTDGGAGGWGVITSCEVRWMMLNPGRCCLVGRCCYVASFVVVYRWGGGGV